MISVDDVAQQRDHMVTVPKRRRVRPDGQWVPCVLVRQRHGMRGKLACRQAAAGRLAVASRRPARAGKGRRAFRETHSTAGRAGARLITQRPARNATGMRGHTAGAMWRGSDPVLDRSVCSGHWPG